MYAVIDIGSNTIRLSIYKANDKDFTLVLNQKVMAGLVGYVDEKKNMSEQGIEIAVETLKTYNQILDNINIKDVFVFATASLRNVNNTQKCVNEIKARTGLSVDVITGEYEGIYDFRGAICFMNLDEGLLVDIGGGSTELVVYRNSEIVKSLSMPIGSLNMYNKFVSNILPKKSEVLEIRDYVNDLLDEVPIEGRFLNICGVGGTIRSAVKLNNKVNTNNINNKSLQVNELRSILRKLIYDRKYATEVVLKAIPERVHTIVPGLIILEAVSKKFRSKDINVSGYGVREGYLFSKLFLRE